MKNKTNLLSVYVLLLLTAMACSNDTSKCDEKFVITRGLNIANWLCYAENMSQVEQALFIQFDDMALISKLGFDHIRIPVSDKYLWDESGNSLSDGFRLLHNGIRWALENELRVVIDMHEVRNYHFREENKENWHSAEEQSKYWDCWRELSEELSEYPTNMLAYELTSTTTADSPQSYNDFINKGIEAIRKTEPNRTIIVGAYDHNSPDNLHYLQVPPNDTNLILACHMWDPLLVTVYKTPWFDTYNQYNGEVNYPGYSIDTNHYVVLSDEVLNFVQQHNGYFSQEVLKEKLQKAKVAAENLSLPLYVSEFGSYGTTSLDLRSRLYRDLVEIYQELGISYAHWDYKGSFNIVEPETLEAIPELVSVLTK